MDDFGDFDELGSAKIQAEEEEPNEQEKDDDDDERKETRVIIPDDERPPVLNPMVGGVQVQAER